MRARRVDYTGCENETTLAGTGPPGSSPTSSQGNRPGCQPNSGWVTAVFGRGCMCAETRTPTARTLGRVSNTHDRRRRYLNAGTPRDRIAPLDGVRVKQSNAPGACMVPRRCSADFGDVDAAVALMNSGGIREDLLFAASGN